MRTRPVVEKGRIVYVTAVKIIHYVLFLMRRLGLILLDLIVLKRRLSLKRVLLGWLRGNKHGLETN